MTTICYKWNDTPFAWNDTPFTWKEGCVIENLLGTRAPTIRKKLEKLKDEDKKILIDLFLRLEVDEIVIEKRMNKQKNTKVKIKLKDIVLSEKVQKNISVNVKFD